jgi:hypothetical protein
MNENEIINVNEINLEEGSKTKEVDNYNYTLTRKHVFMLSKILKKLNVDIKLVKNDEKTTELEAFTTMAAYVFKSALENLYLAEAESLEILASIYNLDENIIIEKGIFFELDLWEKLLSNDKIKSFLSKVPKSM